MSVDSETIGSSVIVPELVPVPVPVPVPVKLPNPVLNIITTWLTKPEYKLVDWVKPELVNWDNLYFNSHIGAKQLYQKNKHLEECLINESDVNVDVNHNWKMLSANVSDSQTVELLMNNIDKIDWELLSGNNNDFAFEIINKYLNKLDYTTLSYNPHPNAVKILLTNPDKINWDWFSANTNSDIIPLLKNHMDFEQDNQARLNNQELILMEKKLDNLALQDNLVILPTQDVQDSQVVLPTQVNDTKIELPTQVNDTKIELPKTRLSKCKLSANPNGKIIELLNFYPQYIDWATLSSNNTNEAMEILKESTNIDFNELLKNTNEIAVDMIYSMVTNNNNNIPKQNPEPELEPELEQKQEPEPESYPVLEINWSVLSSNSSPKIVPLLQAHMDKIDWNIFSANPNIIEPDVKFNNYKFNNYKTKLINEKFNL